MIIKEIDGDTFNNFANNHILKNFYQTKEYGTVMSHSDYSFMYIGLFQGSEIKAGSLILYKTIGPNMKYGYAPRGFLIDYYDTQLLKIFTKKVKEFFFKKGFAFIKINPEITYSTLNFKEKSKIVNTKNKEILETLRKLGYDKLKDNLYFESVLPKYTPVIYLPNYNMNDLDEKIKENVADATIGGLRIIEGKESDIDEIYKYIEDKDTKTISYYKMLYYNFNKSNMMDLLLLELNYDTYVKYLQKKYIYEQERNDKANRDFNNDPNDTNLYNIKMASDQKLTKIATEIAESNAKRIENQSKKIVGCAFVIKHQGRVTILITGNAQNYEGSDLKTFMFYKIIEEYRKAGYLYMDLNGSTADFSDKNPYRQLNEFKLQFKPKVYEYIGELDLIVNKPFHQILWSTNQIQKEFYKPTLIKK